MNELENPTVFDRLLEPAQPFVQEQAQTLTPHHNEEFSFEKFFRLLIYYFVSPFRSINLLIGLLEKKGVISPALNIEYVPYSTFNDALERFSSNMLKAIFVGLLSTMCLKAIPELEALGTLYCVDGSLFPTLSCMLWAEYKKNCQAIKIHLCFELNRMIPVEILVSHGNYSERKALLQMLKAGVTYIADRGYGAFYVYHEILLAHAHFVIRVKENVKKIVKKSLVVEMPEKLTELFKEVTDQIIQYTNDPYGHCYRLVSFQVGSEIFHLLTDRLELTTFQIIMLYAYRWQIELFFKFLKRTIKGIHLIKNMRNGVTIQFYALLILALLELKLKQDILLQNEQNRRCLSNSDNPKVSDTIKSPRILEEKNSTSPPSPSPLKSEPQEDTNSQNRENHSSRSASSDHNEDTQPTEFSAPLSQPHQFFEMIGENLQKYWKIGILWITTLQQSLHLQFDAHTIEILDDG